MCVHVRAWLRAFWCVYVCACVCVRLCMRRHASVDVFFGFVKARMWPKDAI